ncbi:MAG: diaminopimelate epimerase [Bacteroidales bacterium]|nr:diaminopimelate epimerase [Bacteroidales bacterium]
MTNVKTYLMSGAGNKFVVLDGRGNDMGEFRSKERIGALCAEYRTDGLMILDSGLAAQQTSSGKPHAQEYDFRMEFYNPDGSGGMMCGNGGRCIVAFADWLGITPLEPGNYNFLAPDGPHSAEILARPEERDTTKANSTEILARPGEEDERWTVRLKMIDVDGIRPVLGGYFLNTGTRHFVKFVEDVEAVDVEKDGKELRWNEAFAPEGANINFVQVCDGLLKVRTFEKGVEGETLACGTGITASAIAAWFEKNSIGPCPEKRGQVPVFPADEGNCANIRLQARSGDNLSVDFIQTAPESFREIHLTGPAELL